MKICPPAILLSCLVLVFAESAHAAGAKVNPADYQLTVHISSSTCSASNPLFEIVTATIDGKHYQLLGPTFIAKAFMHGNGLINSRRLSRQIVEESTQDQLRISATV